MNLDLTPVCRKIRNNEAVIVSDLFLKISSRWIQEKCYSEITKKIWHSRTTDHLTIIGKEIERYFN